MNIVPIKAEKPSKRKGLSKKIRFEVFKRDSFTCQYCGRQSPDVILAVDHIDPVSKGGDNDMINLITSCFDCNAGKSDRCLDDQTTLAKQRAQLAELNERREQLELMVQWRQGLKSIDEMTLDTVKDHFASTFEGWYLASDEAIKKVKSLIRKFGAPMVMDAIDVAFEQYVKDVTDAEQVQTAFRRLGGICSNKANPDESELFYARGIARKRFSYCNDVTAINLLRRAHQLGCETEELKHIARTAKHWSQWVSMMNDIIMDSES